MWGTLAHSQTLHSKVRLKLQGMKLSHTASTWPRSWVRPVSNKKKLRLSQLSLNRLTWCCTSPNTLGRLKEEENHNFELSLDHSVKLFVSKWKGLDRDTVRWEGPGFLLQHHQGREVKRKKECALCLRCFLLHMMSVHKVKWRGAAQSCALCTHLTVLTPSAAQSQLAGLRNTQSTLVCTWITKFLDFYHNKTKHKFNSTIHYNVCKMQSQNFLNGKVLFVPSA